MQILGACWSTNLANLARLRPVSACLGENKIYYCKLMVTVILLNQALVRVQQCLWYVYSPYFLESLPFLCPRFTDLCSRRWSGGWDLTVAEALALPSLGTLSNALLSCTLYAEGFGPCTTENLISGILRLLYSPPFYIYACQFFNNCSLWYLSVIKYVFQSYREPRPLCPFYKEKK